MWRQHTKSDEIMNERTRTEPGDDMDADASRGVMRVMGTDRTRVVNEWMSRRADADADESVTLR